MGLDDPFGHLKHKLWPKEGPGVKMPIWFLTIKSRESPWFPCMQVTCHILLEISWQGLQLCFGPHFNWRSAHKVIGPQSYGSPNLGNFGIPIWEFRDKMTFGCWPRGHAQRILKGGKWCRAMLSLTNLCLPVVCLCTKSALVTH
jgi:hypothetical protein